ncbi:MAG: hypothetical protein P8077_01025, partial [Gammaproteobacteria bacterium]
MSSLFETFLHTTYTALTGPDWLKFWSIPLLASFIGWFTNWLAIKMTFWPIEFIGIKPWIGWQGIVPAKTEKMTAILTDKVITKLGTLKEFFNQLEPDKIAEHMTALVRQHLEEYTDEIMLEEHPVLWENTPAWIKRRIRKTAHKHIPLIIKHLLADFGEHVGDLVDPKSMMLKMARRDRGLMAHVFQKCGEQELRFVVNSGLYFGFPFGLIQMLVWIHCPQNWVLPTFGLIVGFATNWIAINAIFRPLHPTRIGRFTVQGLFLKRQKEVAEVFCRLGTQRFVTLNNIMQEMLYGDRAYRTRSIIRRHLKPLIDATAVKTMAQLTIGLNGFVDLKRRVEEKACALTSEAVADDTFNLARSHNLAALFQKRMEDLSPEEFQDLMRPAFQEDEWILIALGA